MKRLRWCLAILLLVPLAVPVHGALEEDDEILEGFHYQRVPSPSAAAENGTIQVLDLFWYGCPHCNQLEPYLREWEQTKPKDVEFVRMPAILNPGWESHARAYYVAEVLGITEKIHPALFDAIHRQKRRLLTQEALAAFFAEHGVAKKDFERSYKSFAVQTKVNRARELGRRYGVTGVPAVIVAGKYRSDAVMTGSNRKLIEVINFLIRQESR